MDTLAAVKETMLSTKDNPYNPFTNFNEWLSFDMSNNYRTCEILARKTYTSPDLSFEMNCLEVERAIDEIIKLDPTNTYVKVTR